MRFAFLVPLLGWPLFSYAESRPLSLQEIWQRSDPHAEEKKIAEARVDQAEARVSLARSAIFPNISAVADWRKYEAGYTETQRTGRLFLAQPLFRGFREFSALGAVKEERNALDLEREQERLDRFTRVAAAAYAVWIAETDLANLEEESRLTGLRVKDLTSRVKIGRSRPGDLYAADAQEAVLEAEIERAHAAITDARARFREVTTLPFDTQVEAPPEPAMGSLPPQEKFLEASHSRPGLLALERRLEASEKNVATAKGGHLPSLDFTANYFLYRNGFPSASQWDFGISLSIPIFSGGAVLAQTREASALRSIAGNTLELERRRTEEEARSAYALTESSMKQVQALDRAVKLNRKNYETNRRDYQLGLVTNLEVLQSLTTMQSTLRSLQRARADFAVSHARLHALAGRFPEGIQ